jgi:Fic-DOC domain mobile mystery protein B
LAGAALIEQGEVGNTPIDLDEAKGLIPDLLTQSQLNEYEQLNIATALVWAGTSRFLKRQLLSRDGLQRLHQRMFDRTWKWAGQFRRSNKNIGIHWTEIPVAVQTLCDDIKYKLANPPYELEEVAVHLHYRLVTIHPFPNGNGRHARMAADLLCVQHGGQALPWGASNLAAKSDSRSTYLEALRSADNGDFGPLTQFARSTGHG